MRRLYVGIACVLLSAVGFGVMPIFAIYAYDGGVNVASLLVLRFVLSSLCFFGYFVWTRMPLKLTGRQLISLFLLGGVLYTLQSYTYFTAVTLISASLVGLLLYTFPVYVSILSVFVDKEVLSRRTILSIAIALLGLTMVLGTSFQQVNVSGILLALASAVFYALYFVLGNRVVRNLPSLLASAFISLFASVTLLIAGISSGSLTLSFSGTAWLPVIAISVISTFLAISLLFRGIERIGATKAAVISMLEPVVTIGFSALLFAERLDLLQLLGGAGVLCGAMLIVSEPKKEVGAEVRQDGWQ